MANLAWAVGDVIVLGVLAYEWVSIRRELARDAAARARNADTNGIEDDAPADDDDRTPVPTLSAEPAHAKGQHPLHARVDETPE